MEARIDVLRSGAMWIRVFGRAKRGDFVLAQTPWGTTEGYRLGKNIYDHGTEMVFLIDYDWHIKKPTRADREKRWAEDKQKRKEHNARVKAERLAKKKANREKREKR